MRSAEYAASISYVVNGEYMLSDTREVGLSARDLEAPGNSPVGISQAHAPDLAAPTGIPHPGRHCQTPQQTDIYNFYRFKDFLR